MNKKAADWAKDREESFEAYRVGIDLFAAKVKGNGGLIE